VLALFVRPILVDAGYDASLRDLRDNWAPLVSLVDRRGGLTTAAVAVVAHALVPGCPGPRRSRWAPSSPRPMRWRRPRCCVPLRPPQRILGILEGESLLNDASALLIYRLAVGAVAAGGFSVQAGGPTFLLAVLGSLIAAPRWAG
jgi:CPA1 family monovalent cation:H+ antiporter